MKYWKAMLKGAKLQPQCFGEYFKDGGSCAVGAIAVGISQLTDNKYFMTNDLISTLELLIGLQSCPADCDNRPRTRLIPHLNDVHHWSREAIAEWLKTFEDKKIQIKWNKRKQKRLNKENNIWQKKQLLLEENHNMVLK